MNLVIEIVAYLCEYIMQLLCIHAFLGKKIKIDVKAVIVGLLYVSILVLAANYKMSNMITIVVQIILLLYVSLAFKLKIVDNIIVILLNLLISSSVQTIASLPISIFYKEISEEHLMMLLINMISLLVMIVITRTIKLNKLYNKAIKWDIIIVRVLCIVFFLYIYLFIRYKITEDMEILAYFISAIMVCVVIKIVLDWKQDRYEMKQKSLELHMYELYGKTFEGMIENIRIRQHDFKNQLAAIYGMHLTAENFEELVENQKKYCDYLMEESRYDSILTKCNDRILAGFLYTKFNEWEKKGIKFKFDILLKDSKCKLATYELIKISGILIDNAAEHERECECHKSVEYVLSGDVDKVEIICRNQSDYIPMSEIENFFKKGYSTKGRNRGIGLFDVKKLLEGKGEVVVNNKLVNDKNYIEFMIKIYR